jgi:riboflavin synthase
LFTGLIGDLGSVAGTERSDGGVRLTIASALTGHLTEGDSIAVNGVCLTATRLNRTEFVTDVMHETLSRSSLAAAAPGLRVNLELPLRPGDRLGGHIVQGHVDGLGTVVAIVEDGFARRMQIAALPELLRYVAEKGSIAVDGVSLTVAGLDEQSFTVSLIPETLRRTNLGQIEPGSTVNLEVDVLAKYVERLVRSAV